MISPICPISSRGFGRINKDSISYPLRRLSDLMEGPLSTSTIPALEYLSRKLQAKQLHITFIIDVGITSPSGLGGADMSIIPITPLDLRTYNLISKIWRKAERKYFVSPRWLECIKGGIDGDHTIQNSYLIRRSIIQNEILFSGEGLAILDVDNIYSLKRRLSALSFSEIPLSYEAYIDTCIHLLYRISTTYGGRPLSLGYIKRAYDHLEVDDNVVLHIKEAYEKKFRITGIALSKDSTSPKPEPRKQFPRYRQAPKTPNTASEVTPITKNEWNILVGW
ncbi:MAG: hypothetical protein M1834_002423 [Cirrosporium novae-zelandiae]|nr:MAG: hypothetical protein M1834_002423 [Cirrosporium novae-zelandiae]